MITFIDDFSRQV
jgi:hypothetical protein